MLHQTGKLKNLFKLSHRVTIHCPSKDHNGHSVESQQVIDDTLLFLSQECGGATSTPAVGCWVSASGKLIKEDVTLVFSYCESLTSEFVDKVIAHCEDVKSTLSQESVAVEIDGELYFV